MEKFKGLRLAFMAITEGGSLPTVFNAANEVAVALFIQKKIRYLDIVNIIEENLNKHVKIEEPSVDDIERIQSGILLGVESSM